MTTIKGEANDRVRVVFPLEQDQGWPPVASERLWAVPVDVDLVRIDSVPWFVCDLSLNDIVRTRTVAHGVLEAAEKVSWSGNCTVRIIPFGSGKFSADPQRIIDLFSALGVQSEVIEQFGIIALNVPPAVDIAKVKGLLIRGFESDWWDYEESCIGDAWEASSPRY
ncbi:DUF4265 domain-containing protein [Streptomyces sp. MB09-02B]|uniref:DUF4265 domain-containing protein n=1 Tax=Streptomyces sp. MB09-02B TaxID=3028667 RepID=UPI0029BA2A75|nr:DUF4265 domain-containing protein [Streptomyces sp. MB09-02B]MDX3641712.1 DUF4265 domain-containing protein [Streptomyces sp. MB09-02B]